jgi:hypothetical protein
MMATKRRTFELRHHPPHVSENGRIVDAAGRLPQAVSNLAVAAQECVEILIDQFDERHARATFALGRGSSSPCREARDMSFNDWFARRKATAKHLDELAGALKATLNATAAELNRIGEDPMTGAPLLRLESELDGTKRLRSLQVFTPAGESLLTIAVALDGTYDVHGHPAVVKPGVLSINNDDDARRVIFQWKNGDTVTDDALLDVIRRMLDATYGGLA